MKNVFYMVYKILFFQTVTLCWVTRGSRNFSQLFIALMAFVIYPDIPGLQIFVSVYYNYCTRAYIMQKGCACKFLHGPGTDQEKLTEIEKALEAKTELQVEVQFYRKNGTIHSIVIVGLSHHRFWLA